MKLGSDYSDQAILEEIGNRITQYRLNQNKTQAALAEEAGVSSRTLIRAEHGHSIQASSLLRVLRALQLLDNLDALIPAPALSPVQQLRLRGKQRQRASSRPSGPKREGAWSWGDEE